jgi:FkbM family methyltransferase
MSGLRSHLIELAQVAFRRVGLDVHRWKRSPKYTLLGLRSLAIRTIIDVGAHEGQFSKWAARLFPDARLYSFEPLPAPYGKLSAWARAQSPPGRVTAFNVALGDIEANAEMQLHVDYTYSSSLLPATGLTGLLFPETRRRATIRVREETLDGVVKREHLTLVPDVLVKLDVQGFEDRVIAGGRDVLNNARACIIEVDIDDLYAGQARFPDLVLALDALGLRYSGNLDQYCAQDGHVIYVDAVFLRA